MASGAPKTNFLLGAGILLVFIIRSASREIFTLNGLTLPAQSAATPH